MAVVVFPTDTIPKMVGDKVGAFSLAVTFGVLFINFRIKIEQRLIPRVIVEIMKNLRRRPSFGIT